MISCALFISLFLQVLLSSQYTDALFVWTAPPPAWNQTVAGSSNVQIAVMRVLQGTTNYQVTWKYNLLGGQTIRFKLFSIRYGSGVPDDIGDVVTGKTPVLYNRHDYMARFRLNSTSKFSTLTINRITQKENATFQCWMQDGGNTWAYNVRIEVIVPPEITNITFDRTVNKGDTVILDCKATGYPAPTITWTRVSNNSVLRMPLTISGKQDEGTYRCTAENGFGKPASRDVSLTVQTPPVITSPTELTWKIMAGESVTIECLAESDPSSSYVWKNTAGAVVADGRQLRLHKVNDSSGGNYICTATNKLGSADRSIIVLVRRQEIPLEVAIETLNGTKIVYQPDYNNLDSVLAKTLVKKFVAQVNKKYQNNPNFDRAEVNKLREGSVIVSLVLYFKNPVSTNEGLAELTDALLIGTIGPFSVCCLKILEDENATTAPNSITTSIPHTSSVPSPTGTERCQSNEVVWIAVTGVLIFVIILLIIVIIWQHKRGDVKTFPFS